jgi:hypothetical protein
MVSQVDVLQQNLARFQQGDRLTQQQAIIILRNMGWPQQV